MSSIKVGCGSLTWPREMPRDQVFAEIAQAGYVGVPIGLNPGVSPEQMRDELAAHGLVPAPGYLGAEFWDVNQEAAILARARALADLHQALGLTEMYVAAQGFNSYTTRRGFTRSQIAGHVRPDDSMRDDEWVQFARALNRVGQISLERGVRSCFHNHVGSTIETRAEVDRLFEIIDRRLVFQGPDIGHLVWAGADPVRFCRDYAADIKTIHIKDINPQVLAQGVHEGWDYASFSKHGIFAELGEGMVDFPALFGVLHQAGFAGWVVVETDVTMKPSALESAIISRKYLKSIGI